MNMENLEIELKLTVAHVNMVLKHLSNGVYVEVADLIALLHSQAKPQVETANASVSVSQEAPAE